MKMKKIIKMVLIIFIIIFLWEYIGIPLYYSLFANVNVVEMGRCKNGNPIIISTNELEKIPILEKVLNNDVCRNGLCVVSKDERNQMINFVQDKTLNYSKEDCFKFENHEGFYSFAFNRP